LGEDRDRIADLQVGALGRRNASGGNIGQQYYLFIG
jgi:hypothetical protein